MLKRLIWKENFLFNIKLSNNMYTIAQMSISPTIIFYDLLSKDGIWHNINLNNEKYIFRVFVGNIFKNIIENRIKNKTIIPMENQYYKYWIDPKLNENYRYNPDYEFPFHGGRLIEEDADGRLNIVTARVIKNNLILPHDKEIINKYELITMWGADTLRDRLCRYFETGINQDNFKCRVFPGLCEYVDKKLR